MKLKLQNWIFKLQCEFLICFFILWRKILIQKKKQKNYIFKRYYFGYGCNSFQPIVAFHIESSHLIWTANQMTSLCMKCNTGLKWFELSIYEFTYRYFELNRMNFFIYISIYLEECLGNKQDSVKSYLFTCCFSGN